MGREQPILPVIGRHWRAVPSAAPLHHPQHSDAGIDHFLRSPNDLSPQQELKMSKGQKRSSREQKKPKQNKPKVAAVELVTTVSQIKTNPLIRGKQK
jgi:hypothetical protein